MGAICGSGSSDTHDHTLFVSERDEALAATRIQALVRSALIREKFKVMLERARSNMYRKLVFFLSHGLYW